MYSQFPGQHDKRLSSIPEESSLEASESEASEEPTIQPGSTKKRAAPPSRIHRLTHTIASQDYIGVLIAIVVLVVIIGVAHPDFLAFGQLTDILNQATFVAILACGMTFLLAMRELDLSVGSIYGLTALCSAMLIHMGMPSWISAFFGIVIGALLGLTNGLLIQFFRLPSIVATLATMTIFRGLIFALSNGTQVLGPALTDPFANFVGAHFLGIPTNVWILIVIIAVFTIVLRATPFGYRVRSIGSNPEAAAFTGLPMIRTRLMAFTLIGGLGGLAGMLSLGYFGSADPNLGTGYELLAIAAVVIGGTPLRGGKATIIGAVLGAILLGIVNSGLAYFNVPINWTAFATGVVILLAVSLDSLLRRNQNRQQGPHL